MTYYIHPIWFYLMSVSNGIKVFSLAIGIISTIVAIILIISIYDDYPDDEEKKVTMRRRLRLSIIGSIIVIFIGILCPSKETCIEMMVASQVTHENVAATKEEIYDIIDYVHNGMNNTKEEEQ